MRSIDSVRKPSPLTARELLEDVAGEDHALHTVVRKDQVLGGVLRFWCVCGAMCSVMATDENRQALQNVPQMDQL